MNAQTFHLPDVGEGLTEAEIVNWLVAPGDEVALNQVVCEIETAKSLVELPSPFEGVVTELLAEVGQTVPVGEAILRIRTGAGRPVTATRLPLAPLAPLAPVAPVPATLLRLRARIAPSARPAPPIRCPPMREAQCSSATAPSRPQRAVGAGECDPLRMPL